MWYPPPHCDHQKNEENRTPVQVPITKKWCRTLSMTNSLRAPYRPFRVWHLTTRVYAWQFDVLPCRGWSIPLWRFQRQDSKWRESCRPWKVWSREIHPSRRSLPHLDSVVVLLWLCWWCHPRESTEIAAVNAQVSVSITRCVLIVSCVFVDSSCICVVNGCLSRLIVWLLHVFHYNMC